ncbi:hypothetical protein M2101_000516 [Parabacteroides sp. PM5-20]|uniref:hypothetical protein n=1 Tax=unclassified Parabacteroides TaxID=2649774 RepID=UPI0013CFCB0C|nr:MULTISPECIES: hypothetical protein [unclassified Parabacteroides]MDH6533864.1 hypothetical protein [Parabacteroides sp. PM5-20]
MRKEQEDVNMQQSLKRYGLQRVDEPRITPHSNSKGGLNQTVVKGQFIPFAEALKKLG